MVSRSELKAEYEENSGFAWGEGDDVRFAKFVACLEYIFDSNDPCSMIEVRDELGYDHDVARNACVWGTEIGYVDRNPHGCTLTEEGERELADLFE